MMDKTQCIEMGLTHSWLYLPNLVTLIIAGSLESAFSLILGFHEIWEKSGGDTLALLW